MRGLVLEGGGAKGAYQAGAIKAFEKKGIKFDAVVGTSIGSINGAMYASKNLDMLYKLWLETDSKALFDIDGKLLYNLSKVNLSEKVIKDGLGAISKVIKNKGIDTANIRKFLSKHISEKKLRNSNIDYGLATYNITDKKVVHIFKKDIPEGKLIDYIIASSYLPIFKFEKIIDDKYYLDGGLHSNCPIVMFDNKDFDEIYVVKAWRTKVKYKVKKKTKVHIIVPRKALGSSMAFVPEVSTERFNYGYFETLKYLDNLDGNNYYFKAYNSKYYDMLFDKRTFEKMVKKYGTMFSTRNKKRFIIRIVEKVCEDLGIDRFKIYNMPYLLTRLKYKMVNKKDNVYYDFIKSIKIEFI